MTNLIVCSFSGALAGLPARHRRDRIAVLRVLREHPRFSVFDASEHMSLARTLNNLKLVGLIEYLKPGPAYPWCEVRVTEAGLAAIKAVESTPPAQPAKGEKEEG